MKCRRSFALWGICTCRLLSQGRRGTEPERNCGAVGAIPSEVRVCELREAQRQLCSLRREVREGQVDGSGAVCVEVRAVVDGEGEGGRLAERCEGEPLDSVVQGGWIGAVRRGEAAERRIG